MNAKDRAAFAVFQRELERRCSELRATALQLKRGEINQYQAAGRVLRLANEISKERGREKKGTEQNK